jgi:hypothetical protein
MKNVSILIIVIVLSITAKTQNYYGYRNEKLSIFAD